MVKDEEPNKECEKLGLKKREPIEGRNRLTRNEGIDGHQHQPRNEKRHSAKKVSFKPDDMLVATRELLELMMEVT